MDGQDDFFLGLVVATAQIYMMRSEKSAAADNFGYVILKLACNHQ